MHANEGTYIMTLFWTALLALGSAGALIGTGRYISSARRRQQRATYPDPASLVIEPADDVRVQRQSADSCTLTWEHPAVEVRVYVGTSPEAINRETPAATASDTTAITVTGLVPAARPYFELVRDDEALLVAERVLALAGMANVRDIGGYPTAEGQRVRWGRIYRTGSLADATEADLDYLQNLGVRLVCDLRTLEEITADPDRLPHDPRPVYKHLPIDAGSQTRQRMGTIMFNPRNLENLVVEGYTGVMIARSGPIFGEMLRAMADPANLPALVHCTAGKDRTGVTIALLLAALGVPDEVIIADYSLSNRYYAHFRAYMADKMAKSGAPRWLGIHVDDLQPLLSASPTTMRTMLDFIRRQYGSVEAYLDQEAGVDADIIAQLRTNLLH
jgi:protein-tyrosine phosphatase